MNVGDKFLTDSAINQDSSADDIAKSEENGLRPAFFYLTVALVFIGDQISKSWIQKEMAFYTTRPIIGEKFELYLTQNHGGAWGVLPSGNILFIVFAIIASFALIYAYHKLARHDVLIGSSFALALGGALGNLLDRVRYGYVVDFFYAKIINWPVFNVADSAISVGIVLLLWHYGRTIWLENREKSLASSSVAK